MPTPASRPLPLVAAGAAKAGDVATQAKEAADARVAQLRGEEETKKKGGKLKKLAIFAALAGAAGFVAKKLQGGGQSDNWQSSYVPTPAPAAGGGPSAPDDAGAAAPDEALSDAADEPQPVTTPDEPGRGRRPRDAGRGRAQEELTVRAEDRRRTGLGGGLRLGCRGVRRGVPHQAR